jgi:hypothetical protein
LIDGETKMGEMIDGVRIKMGREERVVPPLSLGQLRRLQNDIKLVGEIEDGKISEDRMNAAVRIIHAALSRNYPDLTIEKVEEMVDLGNIAQIIAAVAGVSGLKKEAAPAEVMNP